MTPKALKPVLVDWNGEAFVPSGAAAWRLATQQYEKGERLSIIPFDHRSKKSHNHFFACVHQAWQNWPEDYPIPLASEDQLRKHALIRTGHYDQIIGRHGTPEAAEIAVRTMTQHCDYAEYSIFEDASVVRFPKTQKKKLMGAKAFQQSKQDVLDFFTSVLGIDVATLAKEAMRMAA